MNIFRDIWNHWRNDWHTNRTMFWFEFLGTLLSILGTTVLSLTILHPMVAFCYTVWLIGSAMIMVGAYMRRASWMFTLMAFNTLMNIVGLATLVLG